MKEKIITLHQSNNIDILIQILSILIKKSPDNILFEDIIITSSNSIKNYVDKKLSDILGVSFNIKYQTINSFIWDVLHNLHPNMPKSNPYNVETTKWFFINLFYSKEYIKILPEKTINLFNDINNNEINIYDFSCNLATLYDQYITYRPEMISKWMQNKKINNKDENEKWQMIIWNYLVNKISMPNRSELLYFLNKDLQNYNKNQLKCQKIFVFGQASLATSYIYALRSLAKIIDVHLLLFNPSEEYWTTFNKKNDIHNKNLNPLLISLSKQYREFFDDINNLNFYSSDFISDITNNNNLLNIIQNDIKNFKHPSKIDIKQINDGSLNIINAYSEIRELQILKDYILNYLNNNSNKNPFDIVVSSPNIEKYIPFINSIFGENAIDNIHIEYNILDTKTSYKQEFFQSIEQILNLVKSRFEVSIIIPIIENKLILKKFNLKEEAIPLIKEIINQLDIHWGWNEKDREKFGSNKEDFFTWSQAIDRIILGIFLLNEDNEVFNLWFNKAPFYFDIYFHDNVINIITLFNTLGNIYNHFKYDYNIDEWINNIKILINDLIFDDVENQNVKTKFEQELNNLNVNANFAKFNNKIPFKLIYHIILKFLNKPKDMSTRLGGITFCNLISLRSIPYSFIALLGLNDTSFPREKFKLPFDLIEQYPQKGDNSRTDDDKYLFLETILNAKDALYLSYIGKNIQNGKDLAPSTLINELIETIAIMANTSSENIYNELIKKHPLQNFSKKYYDNNNDLFTYNNKFFNEYKNIKNDKQNQIKFICKNYKYQLSCDVEKISYLELIKFWSNPIKYWLLKNYNWKEPYFQNMDNDNEPVNFDTYNNNDSIYLKSIINNIDYNKINGFLKKQSKLPTGYSDEYFIPKIGEKLKLINHEIIKSLKVKNQEFNIEFTDFKLNLNVFFTNIHEIGQIEFINSKQILKKGLLNEYKKINFYLKHLIYCCYESKDTYIISINKTIILKAINSTYAKEELKKWIKYYLIGIKNPLPFLTKLSYEMAKEIQEIQKEKQINYPPQKNDNLYTKALKKLGNGDYAEPHNKEYKLIWGDNDYPFDNKLFWTLSEELLLPLINIYP